MALILPRACFLSTNLLKVNAFCKNISIAAKYSSSVKKTQVAPLLTLREVEIIKKEENLEFIDNKRPLVLLFNWLYASQSALDKYCDLYHNIGLDVLTVKSKLVHFLWPPRGEELAVNLMKYLLNDRPKDERIFVHAFSVGAYCYTICETLALEKKDEYRLFRDKIAGQIFDSIVIGTYENMSTGIASALHDSGVLTKPIISIMDIYYNATNKQTKEVYDKLVKNFKDDPVVAPTLIYFSHDDPMCHVRTMEEMVSDWKTSFPHFDVSVKSWEKSVHAAHLKFHREEYLECWTKLMKTVAENSKHVV